MRPHRSRPLTLATWTLVITCGYSMVANVSHAQEHEKEISTPLVNRDMVVHEKDGLVAVEAEHFFQQTETEKRAFHLTHAKKTPDFEFDGDPNHVGGASNGAYLEILPDTRRNHEEQLIRGTNFSNEPGKLAILHYKINVTKPGRYYVWVRAYSTGSEDNGLHVGIDGKWPASGRRLQWCVGKNQWWWESKQRTDKEHCGEPHKIYLDIEKPGVHTVHFSMREDGFEFDKWLMTTDRNFQRPTGVGPTSEANVKDLPSFPFVKASTPAVPKKQQRDRSTSPTKPTSDLPIIVPRQADGDGSVQIDGERKVWHKITLTMNGRYAHEQDNAPNPFLDYRFETRFIHSDGTTYVVPGYFCADGNASDTSAESGTKWRTHFAPDRSGRWQYECSLVEGKKCSINSDVLVQPIFKNSGAFQVDESDKTGRDMRAKGRLRYVGKHLLQHAATKTFFIKAGADAPETLLGYADFDATEARKKTVPLKTFSPHIADWQRGDPTWKDGKGKGLIGAINYLSSKGCNAFSFLTYNAGGDGDNVWPFIDRDDKLHYDCSKLEQWAIVFDHATTRGMYLHFKMQETENDDHRTGNKNSNGWVPTSLDGGNLGEQRKLYVRELVARFGHNLALNWNLGEENTQSVQQQLAMINYIKQVDPYNHLIVVHTFPDQQDKVYIPLSGDKSELTGLSLQNSSIKDTHWQTVKWVKKSAKSGKPWVVAFDESGTAAHGVCPDLGYRGFAGKDNTGKYIYDQHAIRRKTLWGNVMAGGAGVEYYFGYKFTENDLLCEDWRSRDQSWDYCRICIEFFETHRIPLDEMKPMDELIGNPKHDNSKYCLAAEDRLYLVYLPAGGGTKIDLSKASGEFIVQWYNPRQGGELFEGPTKLLLGGSVQQLDSGKTDQEDWLAVIRKK